MSLRTALFAIVGDGFELSARVRSVAARQRVIRDHPHLAEFQCDPLTSIIEYGALVVGRNVSIDRYAFLSGPIEMGDDVMIGPGCALSAGMHRFDLPGVAIRDSGPGARNPIVLKQDVWLGYGVTVLDGVTIGEGSVIGARSVVTRDIPPYSVAVGTPCRRVNARFEPEDLRRHLAIRAES